MGPGYVGLFSADYPSSLAIPSGSEVVTVQDFISHSTPSPEHRRLVRWLHGSEPRAVLRRLRARELQRPLEALGFEPLPTHWPGQLAAGTFVFLLISTPRHLTFLEA